MDEGLHTLDEILREVIGRTKTYQEVHRGIPDHITGDTEHIIKIAKRDIISVIERAKPGYDADQEFTDGVNQYEENLKKELGL